MNQPDEGFDWNDRGTFLRAGISVEVVVLLIGLGLGWLAGINHSYSERLRRRLSLMTAITWLCLSLIHI